MRELLIGCGNRRNRVIELPGMPAEFQGLVTLDIDPNCGADVIWDLEALPYPFEDNYFDSITASEVLEHVGMQGDWRFFFNQFSEFWRILKPGGHLCASVPAWDSIWAWGDPGHTRILSEGTLVFLDQDQYKAQKGKTPMTDYTHFYKADFKTRFCERRGESLFFCLQAHKEGVTP